MNHTTINHISIQNEKTCCSYDIEVKDKRRDLITLVRVQTNYRVDYVIFHTRAPISVQKILSVIGMLPLDENLARKEVPKHYIYVKRCMPKGLKIVPGALSLLSLSEIPV